MALLDLNERRGSLVNAVFLPGKETVDRYEIVLDCKEFAAIGHAVVHWSFLENALLQATLGIAEEFDLAVPADAKQDSFRRRLAAYRLLVEKIPNERAREYHLKLVQRLGNANGQRQILVHGIWDYDQANPEFLIVEKPAAGSKPRLIDVDKVVAFIHEVGRLALDILYPNSMSIEHLADRGPFFSREFLRTTIGKAE